MSNLLIRSATGVDWGSRPAGAGELLLLPDLSMLVKGPGEEERELGEELGWSGPSRWKVKGVEIGWIGAELRLSGLIRFCASLGGGTDSVTLFSLSCFGWGTGDTLEPSFLLVGGVI